MKNSLHFFRSAGLALAGVVALSATMVSCLKNNHDSTPVDTAALMVVNLVTDKTGVSVALNGNSLTNAPLSYSNFTGGYLSIYPGNRTLESYDANSGSILADTAFTYAKDKYYTAFIAGAAGNYRNIIAFDDIDSLSTSNGSAYIRFINAIPDSTKPVVQISANGSAVVNTTAGFGTVSEFKAVTPGNVVIDINNGGGIDADRIITAEANKVYTVLLSGVANSTSTPVAIKYITNGTLDQNGN